MQYRFITLKDFLATNKFNSPTKETLKHFKQGLKSYLTDISTAKKESEEHQKNILSSFLTKTFKYHCNTRAKIDLAIYEDSNLKVLFEVKSLNNKSEFISSASLENVANANAARNADASSAKDLSSLESKAFYESILYFLLEFITHKNNNIYYIILTNTKEFYMIDAKEYVQFAKHNKIIKAFRNCEEKDGNDTSTKRFYKELEDLLKDTKATIHFTYFCIDESLLANDTKSKTSSHNKHKHKQTLALNQDLALIYQVLANLLKRKAHIDANTLNKGFYEELLYILGLEEQNNGGKILIKPSYTPNTLLDAICSAFSLSRVKDFETIFALLITLNNRLLFLRLLESMLLKFKHISKAFLDIEVIKDFPTLDTLFFDVLARVEGSRDKDLSETLNLIPYLNSSLFDKSALESEGLEVRLLN